MGKTKNIIEINGQRYDAMTGKLLSGEQSTTRATTNHAKAVHHQAATPRATPKKLHDVVKRQPAKHAQAHQPTGPKTLMRRAVSKPGTPLKRHTKAHGPSELTAKPAAALKLSQSVHRTNERRLAKAQTVDQSAAISRFSPLTTPGSIVQPTPTALSQRPQANTTASQPTTTADLLEKALHHASGHHESETPQRRSRRTGFAIAGVAALLLIAVVGSQSITPLRMQVASSRAGFHAVLPEYQPVGFSLSKLHYGPGEVATNFKSNSNDTSYTVIQQPVSYDSQALLENVVKPSDPNYRTVSSGGKTMYLYGQRSVAWVDGGILYQIQDQDSLSDPQLLQIASSL